MGICLVHLSNVPPKHKKPVEIKDYRKYYADKRAEMMDLIEKEGTIGQALLKIKLGWGDGMYKVRKSEIIELFPGFISWNSHTKIFTWIKQGEIEQPLTEQTKESLV